MKPAEFRLRGGDSRDDVDSAVEASEARKVS